MSPGWRVLPHECLHRGCTSVEPDLRRNGSDWRGSRCLRTDLTDGLGKNLTGRRAGQVKRETRYDYAAAVAMRYQRSGREQKGWILDEFCAATGYHRKYAIKLLRGPFPRAALPPGHGRSPTMCVASDWLRSCPNCSASCGSVVSCPT